MAGSLGIQIIRCMIFVTSCEFITGIIVNKWLNLNVWDYSNVPFQLFGQICLPFMALFGFSIGIYLGGYCCIFFMEKRNRGSRFVMSKEKKSKFSFFLENSDIM